MVRLTISTLLATVLLWLSNNSFGYAFVTAPQLALRTTSTASTLWMAKKARKSSGKGFGKAPVNGEAQASPSKSSAGPAVDPSGVASTESGFLTSVEGGSDAIPQVAAASPAKVDESIPVEDRTAAILRDQYGLRTREEQQEEYRRQQAAIEQRKKLDEWKKMADEGKDFDIIEILPDPLLIAIDRFLKAGVAICTVLFVLAGVGITVEAYSKTTGNPLPENIDSFIVNTIEPNFTPGLGVLLGFSISLGAFAALQLSSASSTYREDR